MIEQPTPGAQDLSWTSLTKRQPQRRPSWASAVHKYTGTKSVIAPCAFRLQQLAILPAKGEVPQRKAYQNWLGAGSMVLNGTGERDADVFAAFASLLSASSAKLDV
jgi:hypothetical protein